MLDDVKRRLAAVDDGKSWKFNPAHEMFIGTTNSIEMYDRNIDLGRDLKVWHPYQDETTSGYKLTEDSIKHTAQTKALGEFLASCREDIRFLLDELAVARGVK